MLKEKIKQQIMNKFIDSDIKIFTNDDKYFNTIIVSDSFKNKTLVERQKMVYEVIEQYILNREVHAISLKTYTKDEWTQEN
ncbi:MAG TPA: BolA/IbaG family iron-sulfur metabolism protein [Candidatus Azoamicus sp. OHIO2]